jgi:hypothetical protein
VGVKIVVSVRENVRTIGYVRCGATDPSWLSGVIGPAAPGALSDTDIHIDVDTDTDAGRCCTCGRRTEVGHPDDLGRGIGCERPVFPERTRVTRHLHGEQ